MPNFSSIGPHQNNLGKAQTQDQWWALVELGPTFSEPFVAPYRLTSIHQRIQPTVDLSLCCWRRGRNLPFCPGMLGKSFASPLLTLDFAARLSFFSTDLATVAPNNLNFSNGILPNVTRGACTSLAATKKWELHSTAQTASITLNDEDRKAWEACKQALSVFQFSDEEEDKILGKAFGHVHSPYWSEERKKEVPQFEIVSEKLEYLRSLNLSDDDLGKLLKKFPEVLGCSLEEELRNNVQVLAKEWGIEGKSLRNVLLRNPKVLGYNVDCRGDCMAQCTRCWVRF